MAKYGHMATYGHNPHDLKYDHDGYLWKEHGKCNSTVKESCDFDVWVKSYGQHKDFRLFSYLDLLLKAKNGPRREKNVIKIPIFDFSQ